MPQIWANSCFRAFLFCHFEFPNGMGITTNATLSIVGVWFTSTLGGAWPASWLHCLLLNYKGTTFLSGGLSHIPFLQEGSCVLGTANITVVSLDALSQAHPADSGWSDSDLVVSTVRLECFWVTVLPNLSSCEGGQTHVFTRGNSLSSQIWLQRFSKSVRSFSVPPQLPGRWHNFHLVTCHWLSGANEGNCATDLTIGARTYGF